MGGIAATVVAVILATFGTFIWRSRKTRPHPDHDGPVELDGPTYGEHDIEPKPYVQPVNSITSYPTTPWQGLTEPTSAISPLTAPTLPSPFTPLSTGADPNLWDGKHPQGFNASPTQTRMPLSPGEVVQSLVERNVPQAELAAAIRMLAADQPYGESRAAHLAYTDQDAPPMYESGDVRQRKD